LLTWNKNGKTVIKEIYCKIKKKKRNVADNVNIFVELKALRHPLRTQNLNDFTMDKPSSGGSGFFEESKGLRT